MTDSRRSSVDQPRRVRLLFIGSLALIGAAFSGIGAVYAQDAEVPAEPPAADIEATGESTAAGIDCIWTIDTEIGDFADYSSSGWVSAWPRCSTTWAMSMPWAARRRSAARSSPTARPSRAP